MRAIRLQNFAAPALVSKGKLNRLLWAAIFTRSATQTVFANIENTENK